MHETEQRLRRRLEAEAAAGPDPNVVGESVRARILLAESSPPPSARVGQIRVLLGAAGVVAATVLAVIAFGQLGDSANRDEPTSEPATNSPAEPTSTPLSRQEMLRLGEMIFTAARKGSVPMPATVRGAADARGLIVEVPGEILSQYGRETLQLAYTRIVDVSVVVTLGTAPSLTAP